MHQVSYTPIGILSTPFTHKAGIPRQSIGSTDTEGMITINSALQEGLRDLKEFSHLVVVFDMHLIQEVDRELISSPPWDSKQHGIFATCSPYRPNSIGISVVRLLSVKGNRLHIAGIDMANGSPVLDIKPYLPQLFPQDNVKIGWLSDKVSEMLSSKSGDR